MLGSILSNLLLVMGMCFLFGGLIHRGENGAGSEQVFSSAVAQATCSLMTLSSASLILPAAVSIILPYLTLNLVLTSDRSFTPFSTRAIAAAMRSSEASLFCRAAPPLSS